jgi:hypothetical protein
MGKSCRSRIGTMDRPEWISEWQKRARSPSYEPAEVEDGASSMAFWTWWNRIQPQWREDTNPTSIPRHDGNWKDMDVWGSNRLLNVVAGLYFWGRQRSSSTTATPSWKAAVDDVLFVFEQLRKVKC